LSVEWHGDAAMAHVRRNAVRFLTRAAIEVERRAKELLSVAGSGRVKGRKAGPSTHSRPGEPPYKQTGRLRASVTRDVDEANLRAAVGTNVEYGRHLELGTKRGILPRPWLRRALADMQGRINSLLGGLD
jgi:phage gpG-like protein